MTLAAGLLAGAYAHYRHSHDERILFSAGIVASLILTPVLWSHYLILLPAILLALDAPRRWLVVLALGSWVIALPHGIRVDLPIPEPLESSGAWLALAAALILVAYAGATSRGGLRREFGD